MKQNGGILGPYKRTEHSESIFREYLHNADKIVPLRSGSYGMVFKVSLPDEPVESKYSQIRPDEHYGEPVKQIVIKICIVQTDDKERYKIPFTKSKDLTAISPNEFQNEINIQTDIYLKTVKYLQPICPAIVYANIFYGDKIHSITQDICDKIPSTSEIKTYLRSLADIIVSDRSLNLNIGILGMEIISDAFPLYTYNPKEQSEEINMGRYIVLKLALETGYNHNDFHMGNIMIENDSFYFSGLSRRPIIVDFGRASKIPAHIMSIIKEQVETDNYMEALSYLCHPDTAHKSINRSNYNWICNPNEFGKTVMMQNNIQIKRLFELRETAIDNNVRVMRRLHDQNPGKYPLLPVSNAIKTRLYNGIIGGGKRNNKKTRKMNHTRKLKTNRRRI